jgi:phage repressor protein C with HTH and peptisase S24 domain
MQNWTKGLNSPRNENLQKLATALQVTPEWLVTGAGDTHALKAVAATGVNGMFDAYQRLPSQKRKDLRELMDVWARVQA